MSETPAPRRDDAPEEGTALRDRIAKAIPHDLVSTPAVGLGDARRQRIANAVMAVVQPELDLLLGMLERMPDIHMQFGLIHPDGTREELPCADWCWACRVQQAEATVARVRALHSPGCYPNPNGRGQITYCTGCEEGDGSHPCPTTVALDTAGPTVEDETAGGRT